MRVFIIFASDNYKIFRNIHNVASYSLLFVIVVLLSGDIIYQYIYKYIYISIYVNKKDIIHSFYIILNYILHPSYSSLSGYCTIYIYIHYSPNYYLHHTYALHLAHVIYHILHIHFFLK